MTVHAAYRALPPAPNRSALAAALDAITNAPLNALDDVDRAGLVQLLVDDIVAARAGQSSRLSPKDVAQALGAIKSIARKESGSRVIATEKNLRHFLAFAADLSSPEASKQAMRCMANALLLIPSGRDTLVDIEGDEFCTRLYINETSPEYLFLASRLLFFMAHTDGEYVQRVVKQHRLPSLLALRLETLATAVQADAPLAKDALTDMLKLHFTVVSKYARHEGVASSSSVLGEYWDEVFEPTAAPLIRLLHTLPSTPSSPLAPPLTHVIHALLNVPVAPYAHLLFPDSTTTPAQAQPSTSSPRTSRSSSSGTTQSPRPSFSGEKATVSGSAVETSGSGSPLSRALNLLNRKTSPARSKPSSPSPISTSLPPVGDSAIRALHILQSTLALYLPGNSDPDDASVRNVARAKQVVVDELASPVAALITRMVAADPGARARIANAVIPADLDRSSPLEKRDDFLGRCLRLMTSVYYPTLKDAVGEMLFTLCGSDGRALSAAIGYGNAAGFLYNKGIMAPPPASAGGDDVNPITGTRQTDAGPSLSDMTEEEKQREAERLFVLFDRMERMGMAKNPIREAYHSGKFQDP
ncbi:Guanine nucleotide exchange factor synembryn protein [Ceratobasidium sp. AG-Ba]|nr:Guanine nucleotide exchange factor synembryn protein [Ceratobasidium sp. AG-Ba]